MDFSEYVKIREEKEKLLKNRQTEAQAAFKKITEDFRKTNPIAVEVENLSKEIQEMDKKATEEYGVCNTHLTMDGLRKFVDKRIEAFLSEGK